MDAEQKAGGHPVTTDAAGSQPRTISSDEYFEMEITDCMKMSGTKIKRITKEEIRSLARWYNDQLRKENAGKAAK